MLVWQRGRHGNGLRGDGRHGDGRHGGDRHGDGRHDYGRHGDGRQGNGRHGYGRHDDGRHGHHDDCRHGDGPRAALFSPRSSHLAGHVDTAGPTRRGRIAGDNNNLNTVRPTTTTDRIN